VTRVVLAGGGLANCLIALRLRALRPEADIVVVEREARLGGNHTWSFHHDDVDRSARVWLQPLIERSWPAQSVRFPGFERRLETPYYSIVSARLHDVAAAALGSGVRCGAGIADVSAHAVRLVSGETLQAELVIDGRGMPPLDGFDLRWQKFVGLELALAAPHGLDAPVLMDATVEQLDGYRFMYVLPLAADRILVEDTCYSDSPHLARAELRARIRAYAAAAGLAVASVLREEAGVLPIVLGGDPSSLWRDGGAMPRAGLRALLAHHTTGYSLPDAVRLAELVARAPRLESAAVAGPVRELARARWRAQRFFRLLNRLMFEATPPGERYRLLQHFYCLPAPLIARFYAGRTTAADMVRILSGRPPVPVLRALRCMARALVPRRHDAARPGA
jgi:lycopene beta-cyclase